MEFKERRITRSLKLKLLGSDCVFPKESRNISSLLEGKSFINYQITYLYDDSWNISSKMIPFISENLNSDTRTNKNN